MSDFNQQIIDEFRANNGVVTTMGFGDNLVLLHTTGAKSGQERINPLMSIPDGDDAWIVAASAGGSPKHPDWYHNVVADQQVSIERVIDGAPQTRSAVAEDLQGEARDAAWAKFLAASPAFAQYEQSAGGRVIPVVRLQS